MLQSVDWWIEPLLCCVRIADNLPVATRLEFYPNRDAGGEEEQKKDLEKDVQFEHGYRLGFTENNKVLHFLMCAMAVVWATDPV